MLRSSVLPNAVRHVPVPATANVALTATRLSQRTRTIVACPLAAVVTGK
jgi:hypothetical protein